MSIMEAMREMWQPTSEDIAYSLREQGWAEDEIKQYLDELLGISQEPTGRFCPAEQPALKDSS